MWRTARTLLMTASVALSSLVAASVPAHASGGDPVPSVVIIIGPPATTPPGGGGGGEVWTIPGESGNPDCTVTVGDPYGNPKDYEQTDDVAACDSETYRISIEAELHWTSCPDPTCKGTEYAHLSNTDPNGLDAPVTFIAGERGGGYWRTIVTVDIQYQMAFDTNPDSAHCTIYYTNHLQCGYASNLSAES